MKNFHGHSSPLLSIVVCGNEKTDPFVLFASIDSALGHRYNWASREAGTDSGQNDLLLSRRSTAA